ncbi:MAG: helix-turn-helix domain-containing protein [Verrucomicrobiales bacterium]|nr:helix-turn-helix domain-containing protein [Verrucomicrobiales bacterium]
MIAPDKRKALFLLHEQGLAIRQIARQLALSRQAVRRAIAQQGQSPPRAFVPPLDPELVRSLYTQCDGYVQRVWEKLREEHAVEVKYSTLTRWLRQWGIGSPPAPRCQRVPDEPGAEMQHDTSPFTIRLGGVLTRLQASLLYLRYCKRRYLQFYRVFDRFRMKCFLHRALVHWGCAPPLCVIDNTNLARLRGLGSQAVMVPEMEAFAKTYGFRFLCHARGHSDRKAGEERSFWTVETNFLPGRTFADSADLNRQALDWSTVRMEQRPQGKAGLIPAQAFEHEQPFLQPLPPYLPAPYQILERSVDEYGYVAIDANYYWVPGTGRGRLTVLRYEDHLQIYVAGQVAIAYPLAPEDVRNQQIAPPDQPAAHTHPRHRPRPSEEEEKRLRALAPQRQRLCRLPPGHPGTPAAPDPAPALGLEPTPELGALRSLRRARPSLSPPRPQDPRTHRPPLFAGNSRSTPWADPRRILPRPAGLSGGRADRNPQPERLR